MMQLSHLVFSAVRSYKFFTIIAVLLLAGCGGGGGNGGSATVTVTADAGANQAFSEQTSVSLDGSASTVSSGTIASYLWEQTSGTTVTLTAANTAIASFTAPSVIATEMLVFRLTVTDDTGVTGTDEITITVTPENSAPIASAGTDVAVQEQTSVNLDGSGSSDSDGSIATYLWEQISGSPTATINNATTATANFTAPALTSQTALTFRLTVTDNEGATATDEVVVTITPVNLTPTASAGADQSVNEQTAVLLDGGASSDADGTIASYLWEQIGAGPVVTLSNANTSTASFTAPVRTVPQGAVSLTFRLTVTDNEGSTATDSMTVTVNPVNADPVANGGGNQTVNEQTAVTLDGTGSSDSDGTIATYLWEQIGSGPTVTLNNASTATADFTAPTLTVQDILTFRLTVTDDEGATVTDSVTITVDPVNTAPTANGGGNQTVSEQAVVTLDGTLSSDSDGSITTYSWAQTSGSPTVSLTNGNTDTASFVAPALTAQAVLTFDLTVTDNESTTATDTVTITIDVAGHLTATVNTPADRIDLTAGGSLDWAHWGYEAVNDTDASTFQQLNRKSGGVITLTPPVEGYTEIFNTTGLTARGFHDGITSFTWSDGDLTVAGSPTADISGGFSNTGLFYPFNLPGDGLNDGFSFTLPADEGERVLKLYVGAWQAQGQLVATLADGSAPPVTVFVDNPVGGPPMTKEVVIVYGAATTSTTLTVSYTLVDDYASTSNITLSALTLDNRVSVPVISAPGGEFTDSASVTLTSATPNASIYYTTDGSAPSTSSTLYAGPFTVNTVGTTTVNAIAVFSGYSDSAVSSADFVIQAGTGGSLSASISDTADDRIDLTAEGTRDWAHWGYEAVNDADASTFQQLNRMSAGEISYALPLGYTKITTTTGITERGYNNGIVSYTWSNGDVGGTADISGTFSNTGLFYPFNGPGLGLNDGLSITVDADTTQRVLRLYVGAWQSTGQVVASLADGSAPDVTVSFDSPDFYPPTTKVITITYTAPAPTTLTVSFTQTADTGNINGSNLTLQALTLQ